MFSFSSSSSNLVVCLPLGCPTEKKDCMACFSSDLSMNPVSFLFETRSSVTMSFSIDFWRSSCSRYTSSITSPVRIFKKSSQSTSYEYFLSEKTKL